MAAAATAVVAALTASAEATREYRTNMGKLDVAFTDNGHSVGEAAAAYQELVGVIGESDRAVETANILFPNATHGVGTGAGTDADGWMLDAANFWETQING